MVMMMSKKEWRGGTPRGRYALYNFVKMHVGCVYVCVRECVYACVRACVRIRRAKADECAE